MTLTGNVRKIALEMKSENAAITAVEVADRLGCKTYAEMKSVRETLYDLVKSGELTRIDKGLYRYVGKKPARPELRKVMWDYFRMRKKSGASVTVEELQAAAGVSSDYTKEWLRALVRLGIAKDCGGGKFQLLKDPVEMPVDAHKAERLQTLRQRKKQEALELVEKIQATLDELRRGIAGIVE